MASKNKSGWLVCVFFSLLVSACGGGGGGGGGNPNPPPPPPPAVQNVVSITAQGNSAFVSITMCSTTNPQTCTVIEDVLVDTGSYGLRVNSSVVSALNLSQQFVGGLPIAECLPFFQGTVWGPVKYANVQIGGETATNLPIHVVDDPGFTSVPAACTNGNPPLMNDLGFNGILGVGPAAQDCGIACTGNVVPPLYFSCAPNGTNCVVTSQEISNQVQNPVTYFATDNNGVIITLPMIADSGVPITQGTLTFGIGTQDNNSAQNANTILLDQFGYFRTTLNGVIYTASFIDSGSSGYFFNTLAITKCGDFYCPPNTLSLNATAGASGTNQAIPISFNIANANVLFSNANNTDFNNLGGPISGDANFDWGFPFFFGRSVYFAITSANGPYVGF